ncbi:MAG: hypothetical protein Q8S14_16195 [Algoriphagus sp.]|uniref:hypothetical protein n=1 Tax=Algoriphagus sp. TaxID=1872435 RepID=UPI00272EF149|nr:hypothetical protein [Algoriphagus sp.]MDP2042912.1 hypothetical protein [Algoriphagus sp.]MDP3473409.1 hypothetical protein [Algoriphagus sp.]
MKKLVKSVSIGLLIVSMSSCATIFGGPVSEYQRTKPADGEPQREVRVGALIADIILFWPGAIVDFATGAIYKPEGK